MRLFGCLLDLIVVGRFVVWILLCYLICYDCLMCLLKMKPVCWLEAVWFVFVV